jgi:small subunit ribosomal protein S8
MSPITNMLVQIKNAQVVKKDHVLVPFSNFKFKIAQVLKESGFLKSVEKKKKKDVKSEHEYLSLELKYENNKGVITEFKIVSKPSRHMYTGVEDIKPIRSGYGIAVISTSKGVMSSKEARKQGLGGEILFEVW